MIRSSKNWSSLNRTTCIKQGVIFLALLFLGFRVFSQVNFVGNPSFESVNNCSAPNFIYKVNSWNSIDSSQTICGGDFYHFCYGNIPYNGLNRFQRPRTGNGFIRVTFYYPSGRTYPKNRLTTNLINGKTYCVKMFVNLQNNSPNSLDDLGIYLSDVSVDTISYCGIPLSYLTPQIQNTSSNFITDTLGWVEVSGTFTATGNEKYLVIGNFKSDAATTTSATGVGTGNWSEYNVDDVSVIDFNLPAYAGPDKNITLGDSAFIGRPPEVGLECVWSTGTTTVGTGGGLWVKPTTTGTFSYVVTQNICGNIKKDTVNVNISSGIDENMAFAQSISVYPQPAKDVVNISLSNYYEPSVYVKISDVTGKLVGSSELIVRNGKTQLETTEIQNGVYILKITNGSQQTVSNRLVIAR